MSEHFEALDSIKKSQILQGMTADEKDAILSMLDVRAMKRGEVVYEEGTTDGQNGCCWFVTAGHLKVERGRGFGSREKVKISTISAGQMFGEMSFLDMMPHSATVTAESPSAVIAGIARKHFDRLCEDDPRAAMKFLMILAGTMSLRLRRMTGAKAV